MTLFDTPITRLTNDAPTHPDDRPDARLDARLDDGWLDPAPLPWVTVRRIEPPVDELADVMTDETVDVMVDEPALSSYARCADGNGTLTHLFFSDDEFDIARAKAICGKCGLAPTCLGDALGRAEPYGVWGGQLLVDGEVVAVKRGRGRPPKTPRPPLVVDEVPVPPHLVA